MEGMTSNYVGVPHRAITREQVQRAKQRAQENSTEMAVGGAVGTATFATLKNSTKISNSAVKLVQESKLLQASKKAKILKIFGKAKFLKNPVVQKIAGPLAGFAALSSVVGSASKIADTCTYLEGQRPIADA